MKEEVDVHVYVPEELETMWRKERTMAIGVSFFYMCACRWRKEKRSGWQWEKNQVYIISYLETVEIKGN